jgi:hypothetical protein
MAVYSNDHPSHVQFIITKHFRKSEKKIRSKQIFLDMKNYLFSSNFTKVSH